jgi:sugar lactone lactonase YvrE
MQTISRIFAFPFLAVLLSTLLSSVVYAPAQAQTSICTDVGPGATVQITGPDGVCYKVTNTNGSSTMCVPTATTGEWQSFYNNPGAASLASCSLDCAAQAIGWGGGCSATAGALTNGYNEFVITSSGSYSGYVTATCSSGSIVQSSASCQADQSVYVVDSSPTANRVQIFDTNGNYQRQIGSCSSGICTASAASGAFHGPNYIAIDSGNNLWVGDFNNNRVEKFNNAGTYQFQLGCAYGACASGTGNNQFNTTSSNSAEQIAFDGGGNAWIADTFNTRFEEWNSSGTYQGQFPCSSGQCSFGSGSGQFNITFGIAIDGSGNFWLSDPLNHRMQIWNSSHSYVSQFPCASGKCGTTNANGNLNDPVTVRLDPSGNVWVFDQHFCRINKYNSSGVYQSAIGQGYNGVPGTIGSCVASPTDNRQFYGPYDIAWDSSGNMWIADFMRVVELDPTGTIFIRQMGCQGNCAGGSANGQFYNDGSGWGFTGALSLVVK